MPCQASPSWFRRKILVTAHFANLLPFPFATFVSPFPKGHLTSDTWWKISHGCSTVVLQVGLGCILLVMITRGRCKITRQRRIKFDPSILTKILIKIRMMRTITKIQIEKVPAHCSQDPSELSGLRQVSALCQMMPPHPRHHHLGPMYFSQLKLFSRNVHFSPSHFPNWL